MSKKKQLTPEQEDEELRARMNEVRSYPLSIAMNTYTGKFLRITINTHGYERDVTSEFLELLNQGKLQYED